MRKAARAAAKVARDILSGIVSAWNALVRAFEDYPLMVGPIIAMVAVVMLASSRH